MIRPDPVEDRERVINTTPIEVPEPAPQLPPIVRDVLIVCTGVLGGIFLAFALLFLLRHS